MVVAAWAVLLAAAVPAGAQDDMSQMPGMPNMPMGAGPVEMSGAREGSGTSWLPDHTPRGGAMSQAGAWMLMGHTQVFGQAVRVSGPRGDTQAGSVNWFMGMAERPLARGRFTARLMLSAEALSVGRCGYPDLLQSGESCRGAALHDRQHPHDLVMEAALRYTRPLIGGVALELYGGPAGEPALGPTAFPHRPSASLEPIAPIAHHWLDATHVTFGVVTAGIHGRSWKLETSAFNGREPDDRRYGFDLNRLDSWSARVTVLPSPSVSLQVSTGVLRDAEHDADSSIDIGRTTASLTHHRVVDGRLWATTVAGGQNRAHGHSGHAVLAETALDATSHDSLFARAEWVQKTGLDLGFDQAPEVRLGVTKLQAGYTRWLRASTRMRMGLGASVAVGRMPPDIQSTYGTTPWESAVFVTIGSGRKP
jgi:hypothetical protein